MSEHPTLDGRERFEECSASVQGKTRFVRMPGVSLFAPALQYRRVHRKFCDLQMQSVVNLVSIYNKILVI